MTISLNLIWSTTLCFWFVCILLDFLRFLFCFFCHHYYHFTYWFSNKSKLRGNPFYVLANFLFVVILVQTSWYDFILNLIFFINTWKLVICIQRIRTRFLMEISFIVIQLNNLRFFLYSKKTQACFCLYKWILRANDY